MATIISFNEGLKGLKKKAYNWAVKEQKRMGCMAEPICLTFESDCLTSDANGYIVSIFCDDDTGRALLRRDWFEEMGVKYHILTNLDEIKRIAPKSASHLLQNGIKLYRYYDGEHGGVTRKIEKEWK